MDNSNNKRKKQRLVLLNMHLLTHFRIGDRIKMEEKDKNVINVTLKLKGLDLFCNKI